MTTNSYRAGIRQMMTTPNTRFLRAVIIVMLTMMSLAGRAQLSAAPSETVLWSFGGPGDGTNSQAGLIDIGGILYGTTASGGANGTGTVFQLTPPAPGQTSWSENVLWSFGVFGSHGEHPLASLIDVRGDLFGTTYFGGSIHAPVTGTVFRLARPSPGQTQWS